MIDINLYQPGVVNHTVQFPSTWDEFTLQELHLVSKSILFNYEHPSQAAAALFMAILQLRCKDVADNNGDNIIIEKCLDAEDASINGLQALDFIYKSNNLIAQPYKKISVPYFKKIPILKKYLIGLEDDFNNLTCGEFEDAEIFFTQFKENPDALHLANLAAVLYRPKGIKYIQYVSKTNSYASYPTEKMAQRFLNLQSWVLYTIFLWYAGCRNQLPKIFKNCFSENQPVSEDAEKDVDLLIFTKCIHAGAGPKNGSRNEIRCTLLKEFFMDIELEKIQAIELQTQIDAAK